MQDVAFKLLKTTIDSVRAECPDLTFDEAHARAVLDITRVIMGAHEDEDVAVIVTNYGADEGELPFIVRSDLLTGELENAVEMLRDIDSASVDATRALINRVAA